MQPLRFLLNTAQRGIMPPPDACRFYCIDLSHISRHMVRMLKTEALTNRNIKMLLALPDKELQDSVNMCYKRAAAVWQEHPGCQRLPYLAVDPSAVERDEHMSRRLRNLCKQLPKKTIVHIAGWEHCANSAGPSICTGCCEISARSVSCFMSHGQTTDWDFPVHGTNLLSVTLKSCELKADRLHTTKGLLKWSTNQFT